MLKDYSKVLYAINQDNRRIHEIRASIIDQQLIIQRTDFNNWKSNPRTGLVVEYDTFNKENTAKLASRLRAFTSPNFIRLIKQEFGTDGVSCFLSNLYEYCEDFNIEYSHEIEN